jgi:hypothetical protein
MFRCAGRCLAPSGSDGGHLRRLLSPNTPGGISSHELFNVFANYFSQPRPTESSCGRPLADAVAAAAKIPSAPRGIQVALHRDTCLSASATADGAAFVLKPHETSFAVAANVDAPGALCLLATLPGDTPRFVAVDVPTDALVQTPRAAGALLSRAALTAPFKFAAADACALDWLSVDDLTAAVRTGCTATKVSMLHSLKQVCALHSSHAARYGTHLCNDQLHQRRISSLDAAAYGLQAFAQIVVSNNRLQVADVTAADFLASALLRQSISEARLLLGVTGTKLAGTTAVPHASNAAKVINYTSASDTMHRAAPSLLAETDFGFDSLALAAIGEELTELRSCPRRASFATKDASPLGVFGRSSAPATRLNSVHLNLTPAAVQVERSIVHLLSVAAGMKDKQPVTAADALVTLRLAGEILCSLAALYRASAALTILEDETAAHQEATLATVFCDLSRMRRDEILRRHANLQLKPLKSAAYAEYDEATTNCIELGTATAPAAATNVAQKSKS